MKKIKTIKRIFAAALATLLLFAVLTSCKKQNDDDVLSHVNSSEITSSDTSTSEPAKEEKPESSKPENSSKPETSSKPKETSKPKEEVSSKPKVEPPIEIPTLKPTPIPTPTPEPEPDPTPMQKTDAELLIGKWATTVNMAKDLREAGFTIDTEAYITTTYEFTPSSTVVIKIDEEQFRADGRPMVKQMLTQMVAELHQITLEEFAAQSGMTVDEVVDVTVEATIESASDVSEYILNKNGIYIKDSTTDQYGLYLYEFKEEDKLVLTYEGVSRTFTRVS